MILISDWYLNAILRKIVLTNWQQRYPVRVIFFFFIVESKKNLLNQLHHVVSRTQQGRQRETVKTLCLTLSAEFFGELHVERRNLTPGLYWCQSEEIIMLLNNNWLSWVGIEPVTLAFTVNSLSHCVTTDSKRMKLKLRFTL